jgi:hypothetical protein
VVICRSVDCHESVTVVNSSIRPIYCCCSTQVLTPADALLQSLLESLESLLDALVPLGALVLLEVSEPLAAAPTPSPPSCAQASCHNAPSSSAHKPATHALRLTSIGLVRVEGRKRPVCSSLGGANHVCSVGGSGCSPIALGLDTSRCQDLQGFQLPQDLN